MRKQRKGVEKTHIGVELADEAGEVVVLEIIGEQIPRKISGLPNDKGIAVFVPRNHIVGDGIVHQLVRFRQKRRRNRPLRHFFQLYPNREKGKFYPKR